MGVILEYFLNKQNSNTETMNKDDSEKRSFDLKLYGPDQKTGLYIEDQLIRLNSNGTDLMIISNTSVETFGQISNTGSVAQVTTGGVSSENITKEFYIPSSMVTPLPELLPFPIIFFNAKTIYEIVDSVSQIVNSVMALMKRGG